MPPDKWRDPITGELKPYRLHTAGGLASEARKRCQELRTVTRRTAEQRKALADDTAALLAACADALDKLRFATRGNH